MKEELKSVIQAGLETDLEELYYQGEQTKLPSGGWQPPACLCHPRRCYGEAPV